MSVIRGNSCYTIVSGPTWTQAEANAVALRGNLVTIDSEEENIFIGVTFVTITAAVICFPTISLWALFGSALKKFVTDIKIKKFIEYLLAVLLVLTGLFILLK